MEAHSSKSTNPVLIIAAIALILFSAVGIGAIMGWIPTSIGSDAATQTADAPAKAAALPFLASSAEGHGQPSPDLAP